MEAPRERHLFVPPIDGVTRRLAVREAGHSRWRGCFIGLVERGPAATTFCTFIFVIVAIGLALLSSESHARRPERLVIAHSASWTPYAFVDQEGEPRGMLIDLWRLFGERNGVEIEFKLVEWGESIDLVRRGEADVHGGLSVSEFRDTFLDFSKEVIRVRTLLFIPTDSEDTDLAELAGQPVGVVDSTFDKDFIETHFPHVRVLAYPDSTTMVEVALQGELRGFVADYPSSYYRLLIAGAMDEFRSAGSLYTESIHMGVKKGEADLLAFLDAGFDRITAADKARIRERWLIPAEPIPPWMVPAIVACALVLATIAVASHYGSLRRTVRRRTEELNVVIRELADANDKLGRLAEVDELTGAANRRAFYRRANQEIERVRRYARPLSIVLFDLDHFKQVNDRYGHVAGDAVLMGFVDAVGAKLRDADTFARLGGDEFIVMLPETPRDDAVRLTRRILKDLRDKPFQHSGKALAVSFSAGVAEYENDASVDEWIRRADTQLYLSKSAGRAQVIGE